MWSIRLPEGKRLVDQLTLERSHSFRNQLSAPCFGRVQILLGDWYNQLVIHTETENKAAAAILVLSINCLETWHI